MVYSSLRYITYAYLRGGDLMAHALGQNVRWLCSGIKSPLLLSSSTAWSVMQKSTTADIGTQTKNSEPSVWTRSRRTHSPLDIYRSHFLWDIYYERYKSPLRKHGTLPPGIRPRSQCVTERRRHKKINRRTLT